MKTCFSWRMVIAVFFVCDFIHVASAEIITKELFDVDASFGDLHLIAIRPLPDGKNVLVSRRGGVVDMFNLEKKTSREVFFEKKNNPHTGILCIEVIEPPFFVCGVADLSTNMTNFYLKSTFTEKDFYQKAPGGESSFGTVTQIVAMSSGVVAFRSGYKTITLWDWIFNKTSFIKINEIDQVRFRIIISPGIMVEKCENSLFSLYDMQNKKIIYTGADYIGSDGLSLLGKDIHGGFFSSFKKFFWYSCQTSSIFFLDTKINGAKLQSLDQHKGHILGIFEFSLGNKAYIISGDVTGKICLWNDDGGSGVSLVDSFTVFGGLRDFFVEKEQKNKSIQLFVATEKDHIKVLKCSID